ncbi:MAG: fluoride efflux transporter CrcB [Candidatus Thalassarchaeaceae archaeon]|jgi:CrcB protein|nr:fluoride efflux transporter CrcB [Candidatus Thalassarchaeaceae archaeon]MDP6844765.1 fluoride efflux transporter CrcB [Candidatus Thalassarchaeaceae archaeon]
MEPKMVAIVGVGGAIGAVLRYMIGEWLPDGFPWGTLTVNLLGSLLLGILVGMSLSAEMGLLLGTGLMGAFTTMSAYSVDLVELFENSEYGPAMSYLLITLLGCPLLAYGGMKIVQAA